MEKIITIIGNKEIKMRVHTLAKEYGIKATEFVDIIQNFGVDITSHLNALDNDQVEHIKKNMLKKNKMKITKIMLIVISVVSVLLK